MEIPLISGAIILTLLIWLLGTYNGLIRLRNHCRESWAGISTELKRRHDLIPNIVTVVKAYAAHERHLFEQVAAARLRAENSRQEARMLGAAEKEVVSGLRQLIAVAEAFPALKADAHFLHLQRELVNTEDRIQAARRFYNANVRDLNNRVESVPSSFIASLAGITPAEYFEVGNAAASAVTPVAF